MNKGLASLRGYQDGGLLEELKKLWASLRGSADDPSLGYMGASMLPFVGPGTDLVEIGAGGEDLLRGRDKYDALKRMMFGIAGLALPIASAATIKKLAPHLRTSPRLSQEYMYGDGGVGRVIKKLGGSNPNDNPMDFSRYGGADMPIRMKVPSDVKGTTMDEMIGFMTGRATTFSQPGPATLKRTAAKAIGDDADLWGGSPTFKELLTRADAEKAVDEILSRPSIKSGIKTLSTPGDLERVLEPIEGLGRRHIPRARITKEYDTFDPSGRISEGRIARPSALTQSQKKLLHNAVARHTGPEEADMVYDFIKHLAGHGGEDLDWRNIMEEVQGVRGTNLAMDGKGFTQKFIDKIEDIAEKVLTDPNTPEDLRDLLDHGYYRFKMEDVGRMIWPWDN